jgi:hypothetical protein|tara:strand:+ start:132 stop:338 length:207 start_codon:yes stop_codon:yes gene_type:complete
MRVNDNTDPVYNFMHIDPTLIRTRTCQTLIEILLACRNFVDEDLQSRIDHVASTREKEMERQVTVRRT